MFNLCGLCPQQVDGCFLDEDEKRAVKKSWEFLNADWLKVIDYLLFYFLLKLLESYQILIVL